MKKYISIIVLLSLFVIGCSEQTSINAPANNVNTTEPNWIALPQAEGIQVNTEWTSSKKINGAQGGFFSNYVSYPGGILGSVTIYAKIEFYQGAYAGNQTITMTLSDQNTSAKFSPSMDFNRTVLLNTTYSGLDLTGVDPATVKFVYIADDGSIEVASCASIIVDVAQGKLQVVNAKIPHFSRYGFVNKTM
jgi:hypothetical protein